METTVPKCQRLLRITVQAACGANKGKVPQLYLHYLYNGTLPSVLYPKACVVAKSTLLRLGANWCVLTVPVAI